MRKHGVDMWVVPMREYNEDPVFSSTGVADDVRRAAPHDLRLLRQVRGDAARRRRRRVRRADRAGRHVPGRRLRGARGPRSPRPAAVGAAARPSCGATSSGRCSSAVVEERKPKIIAIDISAHLRVHRTGCSAGELRGHERSARRRSGRRGSRNAEGLAARADRRRGCPRRKPFYPPQCRSSSGRIVAGDVLERGRSRPATTRTSDLGVVVAPAGERPRPRHLVPAERWTCSARAWRTSSSATIRSSSAATCCTATSASPRRASTPTRSTSPTCCCPGETDAAGGPAPGARATSNALQDIVRGRAAGRAAPATRSSRPRARA